MSYFADDTRSVPATLYSLAFQACIGSIRLFDAFHFDVVADDTSRSEQDETGPKKPQRIPTIRDEAHQHFVAQQN